MKFAVVINVSSGKDALGWALQTQTALLEHLGARLHSIRLAVPHLLQRACLGAIGDAPDLLVVAGGPRASRRAGHIAHEHGVPILFLPVTNAPAWTKRFWGTQTFDEIVAALAREDLTAIRLAAGSAGGQLFFESVCGGLPPQIVQLRESFGSAETFADGWNTAARAAHLLNQTFGSGLHVQWDGENDLRTTALDVTTRGFAANPSGHSLATPQAFQCAAWKHRGPLSRVGSLVRAAYGGQWRDGAEITRFDCSELQIDAGSGTWLLLDGDAIRFSGPVEFRFLPSAVETFVFDTMRKRAAPQEIVRFDNLAHRMQGDAGTQGRLPAFS